MNMNVLALMCAIAIFAVGLLVYALAYGDPLMLLALAAGAGIAFGPWSRVS